MISLAKTFLENGVMAGFVEDHVEMESGSTDDKNGKGVVYYGGKYKDYTLHAEWRENKKSGNAMLKNAKNLIIADLTFKDDAMDGPCVLYTESNDLVFKGELKNGMRDGICNEYDGDGKMLYYSKYHLNTKLYSVLKNPLSDGVFIAEDSSKNLYYIGGLTSDYEKRDGVGIEYKENHPVSICLYENGEVVKTMKTFEGKEMTEFNEEGGMVYKGEYCNNYVLNYPRHGKGEEYYPKAMNGNSSLKYSGDFRNGVYHGEGVMYYEDGRKKIQGKWMYGLPEGEGKLFKNGELMVQGVFHKGVVINKRNKKVDYEDGEEKVKIEHKMTIVNMNIAEDKERWYETKLIRKDGITYQEKCVCNTKVLIDEFIGVGEVKKKTSEYYKLLFGFVKNNGELKRVVIVCCCLAFLHGLYFSFMYGVSTHMVNGRWIDKNSSVYSKGVIMKDYNFSLLYIVISQAVSCVISLVLVNIMKYTYQRILIISLVITIVSLVLSLIFLYSNPASVPVIICIFSFSILLLLIPILLIVTFFSKYSSLYLCLVLACDLLGLAVKGGYWKRHYTSYYRDEDYYYYHYSSLPLPLQAAICLIICVALLIYLIKKPMDYSLALTKEERLRSIGEQCQNSLGCFIPLLVAFVFEYIGYANWLAILITQGFPAISILSSGCGIIGLMVIWIIIDKWGCSKYWLYAILAVFTVSGFFVVCLHSLFMYPLLVCTLYMWMDEMKTVTANTVGMFNIVVSLILVSCIFSLVCLTFEGTYLIITGMLTLFVIFMSLAPACEKCTNEQNNNTLYKADMHKVV